MKIFTFLILFISSLTTLGQKLEIYAGTQIPLQFEGGLTGYVLKNKIKLDVGLGLLTNPYDKTIINFIESAGAEEEYVQLLENSFDKGIFLNIGGNYMFNNKNYIGIFAQNISLDAATTPVGFISSYTGITVANPTTGLEPKMEMKTSMFQLGIKYGHTFNLIKDRGTLRLELGIGKNVKNNTIVLTEGKDTPVLSEDINAEIEPIIKQYGYTPSINLFFAFRII